jgi:hypothetical protein
MDLWRPASQGPPVACALAMGHTPTAPAAREEEFLGTSLFLGGKNPESAFVSGVFEVDGAGDGI